MLQQEKLRDNFEIYVHFNLSYAERVCRCVFKCVGQLPPYRR